MALIQISEPVDNLPAPPRQRIAVGIDLGTTYSLVASVVEGVATIIVDPEDAGIMPSVVRYTSAGTVIGKAASQQAVIDPLNTIISVKRLLGRGIADIQTLAGQLPYQFVNSQSDMPKIQTAMGDVSPVEVSAEILKALKHRAEKQLGADIDGAVITIPAYFDDAQRQATKDAAEIAGLKVLRLLTEPTAAAVAYGLDQGSSGTHLIFDLGGGTFDVSVLRLYQGVFQVIATGGDSALGGDDIDLAIAHWVLTQAAADKTPDYAQRRELLNLARQAKEQLTTASVATIQFADQVYTLTRKIFEKLAEPIIEKTLIIVSNLLKNNKIELTSIDAIVLVGGATRVPLLRHLATEFFQRPVLTQLDPDKIVALGAAIQADILIGNRRNEDLLLLDILPLSLGLETMGGLTEKIIERNTPIPATRAQQFTTYQDGQTGMIIQVVQGERELVKDCRSLAKFELTGIPPMKAGAARIIITFQVDADGLLSVTAKEMITGVEAKIDVKPSYGLTDEEIAALLAAGQAHAAEDILERELNEAKVNAQQLIAILKAALIEEGEKYLSANEIQSLHQVIIELEQVISSDNIKSITAAINNVDRASQVFAERRMQGNLQIALLGKTIKEVLDAND